MRGKLQSVRGYDDARLAEGRHPTREDLDAVAPDHPVVLMRMCHHIGAANSTALRMASVSSEPSDTSPGSYHTSEFQRSWKTSRC